MSDRETLPINHSTGSHLVHSAGGAAGGILGGLGKAWLFITGAGAAIGAWMGISGAIAAIGTQTVTAGVVLGVVNAGLFSALGGLAIGAVAATVLPLIPFVGPAVVGVVGALGGFFGAKHGHEQVQRDRAAAHMVDAEVGAMQAQASAMQAQAQIMAQSRGGVPSTIYADSAQYDGRMAAAQQLQAAR